MVSAVTHFFKDNSNEIVKEASKMLTLYADMLQSKSNPFGVKALTRAPARITQSHQLGGRRFSSA